jgi:CRP-like cAMP-binding protein
VKQNSSNSDNLTHIRKSGTRVFLRSTDLPIELQKRSHPYMLASGQILFQQGEPAQYLFWVVTGQIRLASFLKKQMITHYFVEAGDLFEESALHFDTYRCTAIAEVSSKVIAVPRVAFVNALQQSPKLSEHYLKSLTHRFHLIKTLLELRSMNSARDRFLHYMLQYRAPGQTTIAVDRPLKVIASELALTPESLSRVLSRLQADGIISRKKRSITFSKEGLEDIT